MFWVLRAPIALRIVLMLVKLIIDNSISKVEGLTIEQYAGLRNELSYNVSEAVRFYQGGHLPTKRYLLDKRGQFPTGLLRRVLTYLKAEGIDYSTESHRTPPKAQHGFFALSLGLSPYPEQIEAVKACQSVIRGTVQAVTGFGKSTIMAMLIAAKGLRTLVVVPNLTLKAQLSRSFEQMLGNLNNIVIENIDSPRLKTLIDFDMLIIDEAHHGAAKTYRKLNQTAWKGIYHRYCFTATPFRSKDEEQMLLESIIGQVIYSVDYHTAVKRGAIVPIEAYYIEVPKQKTHAYTWAEVYRELVVNNNQRNQQIITLLSRLEEAGASTLCLVKEIAHGKKLKAGTGIEFACGEDDNTRMLLLEFNLRERNSLIGTVGVLGEGSDTKPAEWVIIAGLGKSRPAFMQQIGRGLRAYSGKESCKILLFLDKSHKWTRAHFKAQCTYLKEEYGIIPSLLTFT